MYIGESRLIIFLFVAIFANQQYIIECSPVEGTISIDNSTSSAAAHNETKMPCPEPEPTGLNETETSGKPSGNFTSSTTELPNTNSTNSSSTTELVKTSSSTSSSSIIESSTTKSPTTKHPKPVVHKTTHKPTSSAKEITTIAVNTTKPEAASLTVESREGKALNLNTSEYKHDQPEAEPEPEAEPSGKNGTVHKHPGHKNHSMVIEELVGKKNVSNINSEHKKVADGESAKLTAANSTQSTGNTTTTMGTPTADGSSSSGTKSAKYIVFFAFLSLALKAFIS